MEVGSWKLEVRGWIFEVSYCLTIYASTPLKQWEARLKATAIVVGKEQAVYRQSDRRSH